MTEDTIESEVPRYITNLYIEYGNNTKVKKYIVLSGVSFADQIIDLRDFQKDVVEQKVLVVDSKFSAERLELYYESTFKGIWLADILHSIEDSDLSDLHTVEFVSYLKNDRVVKLPLKFCLSKSSQVMIASQMNGQDLDIESGGPYCLVIPGHLSDPGFYSISSINLTTDSCPMPLEMPIMSFITEPENENVFQNRDEVTFEGFAFVGGGRKVLFVEFSTDNGESWHTAFTEETEGGGEKSAYELHKFLFTLELRQLPKNSSVWIRATDQNWVTQPEQKLSSNCPYDNSYFRLELKDLPNNQRSIVYPGAVQIEHNHSMEPVTAVDNGPMKESKKALKSHYIENILPIKSKGLRPTNGLPEAVARTVGGYKKREITATKSQEQGLQVNFKKDLHKPESWRKTLGKHVEIELRPVDERKLKPFQSVFIPRQERPGNKSEIKTYSREEVKQHNTPEDCWIIIREHVYDVTKFVKEHPIGSELFAAYAGTECSYAFESSHEPHVAMMLDEYYVGKLQTFVNKALVSNLVIPAWGTMTIIEKRQLTHDTFEFKLKAKNALNKIPLGAHFFLTLYDKDGAKVCRPYNLVKVGDDKRDLFFAIKIYQKSSINPQGGKFTQMLDKLKKGDMVKSYGPVSHLDHLGKGFVEMKGTRYNLRRLVMLVGGTGVTPMMGLLDKFLPLGNEACLICCNRTEDDIIYRTRLVEHVKQHPQFVLSHVIEWVPVTAMHRWNYYTGLLKEVHITKTIKAARKDDMVFLCGRWSWVLQLREMLMDKFGYHRSQFINF